MARSGESHFLKHNQERMGSRFRLQYLWLAAFWPVAIVLVTGNHLFPAFMERYRILIWTLFFVLACIAFFYQPCIFLTLGKSARQAFERADFVEAEKLYETLIKKAENLRLGRYVLPFYITNLALVYRLQARYGAAEMLHERAADCWKIARRPDPLARANNLTNLAIVYFRQGRYSEAETLFQALLHQETERAPTHIQVAVLQCNLAELYTSQGRYPEAESLYQEARAQAEKSAGAKLLAALLPVYLAECHVLQGRKDEALPLARDGLATVVTILGSEHYETGVCHFTLAEVYRLYERYGEAESSIRRALATWERAHGPNHPTVALGLHRLSVILASQGKYAEAEPKCKRSLRIREEILGADHPDVHRSQDTYADILRHLSICG
jgi:tetratricopeptide (TPR) repeat protein